MKEYSRIRFNPVTKEIEVEGSESFVKAYFNKLQKMILGSHAKVTARQKRKTTETTKVKRAIARKIDKTRKREPRKKKLTNIDKVLTLIRSAPEGIETAALKKKTGLSERQIWSIVNRATKEGKIRKTKRGVYSAVAA